MADGPALNALHHLGGELDFPAAWSAIFRFDDVLGAEDVVAAVDSAQSRRQANDGCMLHSVSLRSKDVA